MSVPFGNGRDSPRKGLGVISTSDEIKKPPDDDDLDDIDSLFDEAEKRGKKSSMEKQRRKAASKTSRKLVESMVPERGPVPGIRPYVREESTASRPQQARQAQQAPQSRQSPRGQVQDASSDASSDVPQVVPPPFAPMPIPVSLSQDPDASLDIPPPRPRRASRPKQRDSQQAQEQRVPQYDAQNMSRDEIQKILLEDPRQVISLPISIPSTQEQNVPSRMSRRSTLYQPNEALMKERLEKWKTRHDQRLKTHDKYHHPTFGQVSDDYSPDPYDVMYVPGCNDLIEAFRALSYQWDIQNDDKYRETIADRLADGPLLRDRRLKEVSSLYVNQAIANKFPEWRQIAVRPTINALIELGGLYQDADLFVPKERSIIETGAMLRRIVASAAAPFFTLVSKLSYPDSTAVELSSQELRSCFIIEFYACRYYINRRYRDNSLFSYIIAEFGKDTIDEIYECVSNGLSLYTDIELGPAMEPLCHAYGRKRVLTSISNIYYEFSEVFDFIAETSIEIASAWLIVMVVANVQDAADDGRQHAQMNLLFTLCFVKAPFMHKEVIDNDLLIQNFELKDRSRGDREECPLDYIWMRCEKETFTIGNLASILYFAFTGNVIHNILQEKGEKPKWIVVVSTFMDGLGDMVRKSVIFIESILDNMSSRFLLDNASARVLITFFIHGMVFHFASKFLSWIRSSGVDEDGSDHHFFIQDMKDEFVSTIHGLMDALGFEWRGNIPSPLLYEARPNTTAHFDERMLLLYMKYACKIIRRINDVYPIVEYVIYDRRRELLGNLRLMEFLPPIAWRKFQDDTDDVKKFYGVRYEIEPYDGPLQEIDQGIKFIVNALVKSASFIMFGLIKNKYSLVLDEYTMDVYMRKVYHRFFEVPEWEPPVRTSDAIHASTLVRYAFDYAHQVVEKECEISMLKFKDSIPMVSLNKDMEIEILKQPILIEGPADLSQKGRDTVLMMTTDKRYEKVQNELLEARLEAQRKAREPKYEVSKEKPPPVKVLQKSEQTQPSQHPEITPERVARHNQQSNPHGNPRDGRRGNPRGRGRGNHRDNRRDDLHGRRAPRNNHSPRVTLAQSQMHPDHFI